MDSMDAGSGAEVGRVFISYTKSDRDFVQYLRHRLEEAGINVGVFEDERRAGDWLEQWREELNRCRVAIFVLSPAWFDSDWCRREWDILYAGKGKADNLSPIESKPKPPRLVPVVLVRFEELRQSFPEMTTFNRVDFSDPSEVGRDNATRELLGLLRSRDHSFEPSPRQVRGRNLSLVRVLALVLTLVGGVVLALATAKAWTERQDFEALKDTQAAAQSIDQRVADLVAVTPIPRDVAEAKVERRDPNNGELLAEDEFLDGRLDRRLLFRQGKLIALDQYTYVVVDGSGTTRPTYVVTEKRREHLDERGRTYLIDLFNRPHWRPLTKLECAPGKLNDCVTYHQLEPNSPPAAAAAIPIAIGIFYR